MRQPTDTIGRRPERQEGELGRTSIIVRAVRDGLGSASGAGVRAGLGIVGLGLALACHEGEAVAPVPPDVVVEAARQQDVPVTSEWIGTTTGFINAQIRARVRGYLLSRDYTEGGLVQENQRLFTIDPRPYEATLQEARGELGRAQAALTKSALDVERYTPLAAEGAVSQQELDDAIQAKRANEAAVETAEANVTQAKLNLGWTKVQSPIDGIAGLAVAQIGDLIEANTLLTTVSQLDPIKVDFPISEQEYLKYADVIAQAVRAQSEGREGGGPEIELVLANGSTYAHKGRMTLPNRQVDQTTGTIIVQGLFPNPDNILRPGQYGLVRAVTETLKDAVVVPQRAVQSVQGQYQVVVVKTDDTVEIRGVEMGPKDGTDWVVSKGLSAGEKIVVEGLQRLRDGMKVAVQPAPPSKPAATKPADGSATAAAAS